MEAPAIDFKNIPMIKFLREKGEKKIAEKRFLRRTQVASGISGSSSSGKGGKGSRGSEKERGDRSGTAGGDRSSGKSSGSGLAPLKVRACSIYFSFYHMMSILL